MRDILVEMISLLTLIWVELKFQTQWELEWPTNTDPVRIQSMTESVVTWCNNDPGVQSNRTLTVRQHLPVLLAFKMFLYKLPWDPMQKQHLYHVTQMTSYFMCQTFLSPAHHWSIIVQWMHRHDLQVNNGVTVVNLYMEDGQHKALSQPTASDMWTTHVSKSKPNNIYWI